MTFRKVSGWVAECNACGDDVGSEYILNRKTLVAAIKDDGGLIRGDLTICYHCIEKRACRIFGHRWNRSNACGRDHCSRCREIKR